MAVHMAVRTATVMRPMTTGMLSVRMQQTEFMRFCMFLRRHHFTASVTVSPLMFHSFWWPSSSP